MGGLVRFWTPWGPWRPLNRVECNITAIIGRWTARPRVVLRQRRSNIHPFPHVIIWYRLPFIGHRTGYEQAGNSGATGDADPLRFARTDRGSGLDYVNTVHI